jgi:hypothetical protein
MIFTPDESSRLQQALIKAVADNQEAKGQGYSCYNIHIHYDEDRCLIGGTDLRHNFYCKRLIPHEYLRTALGTPETLAVLMRETVASLVRELSNPREERVFRYQRHDPKLWRKRLPTMGARR